MKRMGNVLVAVAMMIGAFGAVGCKQSSEGSAQPETAPVVQQPLIAPATPVAQPAAQKEAVSVVATTTARLPAPPALRIENPGSAPSSRHRWMRGYWRYDAPRTVYVWVPGFWEDESVVAPYAPPARRFEDPGRAPSADYYHTPGYWRWSGREYVWVPGHWTLRRDAGFYYRPHWENVNGRWVYRLKPGEHPRTDRGDHRDDDCRDGDRGHRADAKSPKRPSIKVTGQVTVSTTPVKRGHG